MINEAGHQDEQEKKFGPNRSPESAVTQAIRVIENTEIVKDSKRQVRDGTLLGTCLVFIAAMLSLSGKQMDATLTFALTTFASAIPLLVFGFWTAGFKPKPVQGGMVGHHPDSCVLATVSQEGDLRE